MQHLRQIDSSASLVRRRPRSVAGAVHAGMLVGTGITGHEQRKTLWARPDRSSQALASLIDEWELSGTDKLSPLL